MNSNDPYPLGDEPKTMPLFDLLEEPLDRTDYVPSTDEQFEYRMRRLMEDQNEIEKWTKLKEDQCREATWAIEQRYGRFIARFQRDADHQRSLIEEGLRRREPDKKGRLKVAVPSGTVYLQRKKKLVLPEEPEKLIELGQRLGVPPKVAPRVGDIRKAIQVMETESGLVAVDGYSGEMVEGVSAEWDESIVVKGS